MNDEDQFTEHGQNARGLVSRIAIPMLALVLTAIGTFFEPEEWFRGADVGYQILPVYTMQGESITGVSLSNEGRGVAQGIELEITTIQGTSIRKVEVEDGDLSKKITGTSCQIVTSGTVTCSISRMLVDSKGAIFVQLESPDELAFSGIWGDRANQIRLVEHQASANPLLQVLEAVVFYVGLVTLFNWVLKRFVIWFGPSNE